MSTQQNHYLLHFMFCPYLFAVFVIFNHFSMKKTFSGYTVCDTWMWQAPMVILTVSAIQFIFTQNYYVEAHVLCYNLLVLGWCISIAIALIMDYCHIGFFLVSWKYQVTT